MDISSLLSPSDSPAGTPTPQPPPAIPSPSMLRSPGKNKRAVRQMPSRTPSGLSQQITSSPQPHAVLHQVSSPGIAHIANGARSMHSAMSPQPLGSPRDARMTPPHTIFRQASTPGMDTLAGMYPLVVVEDGGLRAIKFRHRGYREENMKWNGSKHGAESMATNRPSDLASMQQQQKARQTRPVT